MSQRDAKRRCPNINAGDHINRLTLTCVPYFACRGVRPTWYGIFLCDCGLKLERSIAGVIGGSSTSCGCLKRELLSKARGRKSTTKDRSVSSDGYVRVYLPNHPKQHGGLVKEHTIIAEKALGKPLPKTVHIHHFDMDESNNAHSNLVICQDSAYHMTLHARQRIKAAGGNPDTELICIKCKAVKGDEDFCRDASADVYRRGRNQRCRSCASKLATKYREQRCAYERKRREALKATRGSAT